MKKIKLLLILTAMLVLIIGCESGGKIEIINATAYNVYTTIESTEYTVAGNSSKTVKVDTDKKIFLVDDGETKKSIDIDGETFRVFDSWDGHVVTNTTIKIEPGKTTRIYCAPNCASLKVVNNSDKYITKIEYRRVYQFDTRPWITKDFADSLGAGEFSYVQLEPYTEDNAFFYNFIVSFSDGTVRPYGTEQEGVYLSNNEQYPLKYSTFGEYINIIESAY